MRTLRRSPQQKPSLRRLAPPNPDRRADRGSPGAMRDWAAPPPRYARDLGATCVVICVGVAVVACGASRTASDTGRSEDAGHAVPLVALSGNDLKSCHVAMGASRSCPCRVPRTPGLSLTPLKSGRRPFRALDFAAGVGSTNPDANRPPEFLHLVFEHGDLRDAFETFDYPMSGRVTGIRNGLARASRSVTGGEAPGGIFLGHRTWGSKRGTLVLAPPPSAVDSLHAGHLMFRWGRSPAESMASIHAWEPFTAAVATLREIVRSVDC